MPTSSPAPAEEQHPEPGASRWLQALLAVAFVFAFWPFLTGEAAFTFRDTGTMVWPQRLFVARAFAQGRLPLWNELFAYGFPAYADPIASVWYPLNLLVLLLPVPFGYSARVFVHYPIAMASMWMLARELGLGRLGCTVAAGALALGGFAVSCTSLPAHLGAVAWVPLALACFLRGMRTGRLRWVCASAGLVALSSLEVDPIWPGLTWGLAALLAWARTPRPPARLALSRLALLVVLSGTMTCLQMVPFARFLLQNPRDPAMVSKLDYRMELGRLPTFAVPLARTSLADPLFLSNFPRGERGFIPYIASYYLGLPVLLLAAAGLASRSWRAAPWLGGAAALAAVASFGEHLPVVGLLANVPPFSLVRYAEKAMGVACLLLPLLAGHGAGAWAAREERAVRVVETGSKLALVIAAVWCGGSALLALVSPAPGALLSLPTDVWPVLWIGLALAGVRGAAHLAGSRPGAACLVLAAVVLGDLATVNRDLTFPGKPELFTDCTAARKLPAAELPHRTYTWVPPGLTLGPVHGVIPVERATESRWNCGFNLALAGCGQAPLYAESSMPFPSTLAIYRAIQADLPTMPALLRASGCEYLIVPVPQQLGPDFESVPGNNSAPYVYRVLNPVPRVFLATGAFKTELPLHDWLEWNRQPGVDPRVVMLPTYATPLEAGAGPPGEARLVTYRGGSLDVEVQARRPGLLVVMEASDPGWRATVDGRERTLEKADGAFLALRVAPGERRVELRYRPRDLVAGAGLSLAGVVAALALAVLY